MHLDPAAVSLMLRGKRKMTNEEAHRIADLLGVTVTEVLRRSGIEVLDDVRKVPISAWVDEQGVISLFPEKTHETVIGPADCPAGTYGVQVRSPTGPQDGWLLFVSPAQEKAADVLDRLCLVTTPKGHATVAIIRRGYRVDRWNLIVWPSRNVNTDTTLVWCSRVLWIKPLG